MPSAPLSEAAPILKRPTSRPKYLDEISKITINNLPNISNQDAFNLLIRDLNVSNKSLIYDQYDSTVGTNVIKKAGKLGAAVMRIKQNGRSIAMGMECNTRHNYVDPKIGAAAAVAASGRKVAMSGATPLAITDCLNYGNPQNPEVMWQFAQGCEGIKEACAALNTPVVSGNVSLYNETDGVSIQPTPSIVSVGVGDIADRNLISEFSRDGVGIYLLGKTTGEFAGSLYMKAVANLCAGELKEIDYRAERALWDLVIEANKDGILEFANSVGVGGIAITLAKMAAVSSIGFSGEIKFSDDRFIFDESFSRAIVGVKDELKFKDLAKKYGVELTKIGLSGGDEFVLNDIKISLKDLQDIYFSEFATIIKSED